MNQKQAQNRRRKLITAAIALAVVFGAALLVAFLPFERLLPAYRIPPRGEGELRLHFVDVGQGDCTIVEFPEGDLLVVDAGDGSFSNKNKVVRYIKGLKPTSITMLATHADIDHFGGFAALLKTFGAEKFYLPVLGSDSEEYVSLLNAIEKAGCKVEKMTRYHTVESVSGAYAVCLSPYLAGEIEENDSSTVLYLCYGGVSALLCGDISTAREEKLVREYALDETLFDSGNCSVRLSGVDVVKLAHHGSANSSSEAWLNLLKPKTAVVSCGRGNSYSHPSGETLLRLKTASPNAEIYRTDERGDIIVSIKNDGYTVLTDWRNI